MSTTHQTSPSKALSSLQNWLKDGSLAIAVKEHQLGSEFDEVRNDLRAGKADMDRVKALHQAADLISDVPWESVQELVKRLENAGTALEGAKTPDELFEWRRALWKLAKESASSLERVLKNAWLTRCQTPFSDHERLGTVLKLLPNMKDLGGRMIKTAGEGKQLGYQFPPSEKEKATLKKMTERASKEREELRGHGANDAISGLLMAVAESRATLADLTPEALEWLRKSNALKLFELNLARVPAR